MFEDNNLFMVLTYLQSTGICNYYYNYDFQRIMLKVLMLNGSLISTRLCVGLAINLHQCGGLWPKKWMERYILGLWIAKKTGHCAGNKESLLILLLFFIQLWVLSIRQDIIFNITINKFYYFKVMTCQSFFIFSFNCSFY